MPSPPCCAGVRPPVNVVSELRRSSRVPSLASRRALLMVQAASLFNQLLQHFPRTELASLVQKHPADRAARGCACSTQLASMTFCQLAHADSLREICNGLA